MAVLLARSSAQRMGGPAEATQRFTTFTSEYCDTRTIYIVCSPLPPFAML
jgi:hypothetical protein